MDRTPTAAALLKVVFWLAATSSRWTHALPPLNFKNSSKSLYPHARMSVSPSSPFSAATSLAPHWALYPRTYLVRPVPPGTATFSIDGNLDKGVWRAVSWSEPWRDIQGDDDAPPDAYEPALTKFRALYDAQFLYIGAVLDPSPDFGTTASFTHRNDPIYRQDSDFEVFVDVFGSHHQYKELEVNAWNTVWNLLLDRPYLDGGREHSGRIAQPGDPDYYEVQYQKTGTRIVEGNVNEEKGAQWTVEAALSYRDLFVTMPGATRKPSSTPIVPQPGTFWRVNFSRVELRGEVNWTWQPQRVWNASLHRYEGQINMHLPEAWGYFYFADADWPDDRPPPRDPTWPVRLTAAHVYQAQAEYHSRNGRYATELSQLQGLVDPAIVEPFVIVIHCRPSGSPETGETYQAVVTDPHSSVSATIHQDRYLEVSDQASS